jgi:hypothetical protein
MVRSTTIFRTHDALPLAASVDDETVSFSPFLSLGVADEVDGESIDGIQATIQARF